MHVFTLTQCKCTRAGEASVTRHIRRTRRIRRAADAQLPIAVVAPALDPTPVHNRARVLISQGDGDGGNTCRKVCIIILMMHDHVLPMHDAADDSSAAGAEADLSASLKLCVY